MDSVDVQMVSQRGFVLAGPLREDIISPHPVREWMSGDSSVPYKKLTFKSSASASLFYHMLD